VVSSTNPGAAYAPPTILVTRPSDDAAALSDMLEAAGFAVLAEPLLSIADIPPTPEQMAEDLEGVQALLFTSANGVRAFARHTKMRGVPAYCVGPATADAARLVGFSQVETAAGDVAALAALTTHSLSAEGGALFHAAGSDVTGDLAGRLRAAGFTVTKRALYKATMADALSAPARRAIAQGTIAAVVLFSPRTAVTFRRLLAGAELSDRAALMTAACLSEAVAAEINDLTWHNVLIANAPESADIVALLRESLTVRVRLDENVPDIAGKAVKIDAEQSDQKGGPANAQPIRTIVPNILPNRVTEGTSMSDDKKAGTPEPSDTPDSENAETGNPDTGTPAEGTPNADAVINAFGGIRPMANQLDVAVSTVQGWKTRNHIPENRWRDIIAAASAAGVDLGKLSAAAPQEGEAASPWGEGAAATDAEATQGTASPEDDAPTPEGDAPTADAAAKPASRDKPARDKPARAKPKPAPKSSGGGLALLIAAVAILAVLSEPYWRQQVDQILDPVLGKYVAKPAPAGGIDPAQVEALAQDIAALSGRIEDVAAKASDALQAGGDDQALSALNARIDDLENSEGDGGLTPAALAEARTALSSRIDEVEEAVTNSTGAQAMATLRDRVAALESLVQSQNARIEEVAKAPALKGAQQAATLIAVGSIQDALAAGRGFDAPLARVAQLDGQDAAIAEAVADLQPYAVGGLVTRAALIRRFNASSAEMHAALAGEGNWIEDSIGRITSLVSVRQTGESADRPAVSRAEGALSRGDLAGAVAALSEIEGDSAAAAKWLGDANARLQAEAAVATLRAAVTERLTIQAGG